MNIDWEGKYTALMGSDSRDFNPKSIRLSESGFDPRYRLLKALGVIKPSLPDEKISFIFWFGKMMEDKILKLVNKDPAISLKREAKIKTPWGDTGHVDALIKGTKEIIEVKTIGDIYNAPQEYNIMQVQAYLLFGQFDLCHLVYISRNGQGVRAFKVYPDADKQREILFVLQKLHDCVKSDYFPHAEEDWHGIDFSRYHRPLDFVKWQKQNPDFESINFNYDIDRDAVNAMEAIGNQVLEARANGDDKAEKVLKARLVPYYEIGINNFSVGDVQFSGSKQVRESLNLKDCHKCNVPIPAELAPYRVKKEYWVTKIKSKKQEDENEQN